MTPDSYAVGPVSTASADSDLLRDCSVATTLLHKIMTDSPSLTANEAYEEIRRRLSDVCVFQWDRMRVVRKN